MRMIMAGNKFHSSALVLSFAALIALGGCTSSSSSNTSLHGAKVHEDKPTGAVYVEPAVNFDKVKDIDSIRADDVNKRSKAGVSRTGEIYLMRGLADVFSRGIDKMARDLHTAAKNGDYRNSFIIVKRLAGTFPAANKAVQVLDGSIPIGLEDHELCWQELFAGGYNGLAVPIFKSESVPSAVLSIMPYFKHTF